MTNRKMLTRRIIKRLRQMDDLALALYMCRTLSCAQCPVGHEGKNNLECKKELQEWLGKRYKVGE